MRVLFDNGTPRGVAAGLADHVVERPVHVVGTLSRWGWIRKPGFEQSANPVEVFMDLR